MEHVKQAPMRSPARARYVGPSAARIAELIAPEERVRFERGWFWTAAVCHQSEQDQLSFRQRPDGDGIDVRCKSAGCSRERITHSLEQLTGTSIWSAYSTDPRPSASAQASADETGETVRTAEPGGRSWRLAVMPLIILLLAAPLVLGFDPQVAALNAVGIAWVGWLARHLVLSRRRVVSKGGRPR